MNSALRGYLVENGYTFLTAVPICHSLTPARSLTPPPQVPRLHSQQAAAVRSLPVNSSPGTPKPEYTPARQTCSWRLRALCFTAAVWRAWAAWACANRLLHLLHQKLKEQIKDGVSWGRGTEKRRTIRAVLLNFSPGLSSSQCHL